MGFCRRCGEIVSGARCPCGGTAVAPVVLWNQLKSTEHSKDKWSNTYVVKKPSVLPTQTADTSNTPPSSPSKRFTRPTSTAASSSKPLLGTRVTEYIATTTSQTIRPPSPLKYSTIAHPESDILPSMTPYDTTLSKVYGSVLQPKETLTTHSCSMCASPFPPDATIYPDPLNPLGTSRFLCRSCFTNNGGSKGTCPTCGRPVLILKSEGGFVQAAGKYWHKLCFTCEGCFKNIGASPMVDLLGRPSCVECFDNCLNQSPSTPKRNWNSNVNSPRVDKSNLGGMSGHKSKSREGSPAIEELEQRLGIVKSREASPALEELSQRLSMIGKDIGSKYASSGTSPVTSPLLDRSRIRRNSRTGSDSMISGYERLKNPEYDHDSFTSQSIPSNHSSRNISPVRRQRTGSPAPTQEAIDEMKQRFLKGSSSIKSSIESPSLKTTSPLRISRSSTSLRNTRAPKEPGSPLSPVIPPTPDLVSDFSDSTTQSSVSCPDSPPSNNDLDDVFNVSKVFGRGYGTRYTRGDFLEGEGAIIEETNSQLGTPTRTPKSIVDLVALSAASLKDMDSPLANGHSDKSPRSVSQAIIIPTANPASSICAGCQNPLFSTREGGGYINVPGEWKDDQSKSYHNNCFTCQFCHDPFEEDEHGKAIFVKANGHPHHVNCAPTTKCHSVFLKSVGPTSSTTMSPSKSPTKIAPFGKFDKPPLPAPLTPGNISFPRFGSRTSCPGCHQSVSPMEQGVIPGPQGTRWHVGCLVCGGKKERLKGFVFGHGRNGKKDLPGCGKRLDSAAKTDGEGGVWCRECLLLLGVGGSPQASPTRAPLQPSYTGLTNRIMTENTGTTTIARQFTGMGGGDPGLFRQLTGGGLSPTRSISPTKQLGMMGGGMRPRPKSVIGMRNTKSIDEGRGMYLVRQMTGSTSTSGWREG